MGDEVLRELHTTQTEITNQVKNLEDKFDEQSDRLLTLNNRVSTVSQQVSNQTLSMNLRSEGIENGLKNSENVQKANIKAEMLGSQTELMHFHKVLNEELYDKIKNSQQFLSLQFLQNSGNNQRDIKIVHDEIRSKFQDLLVYNQESKDEIVNVLNSSENNLNRKVSLLARAVDDGLTKSVINICQNINKSMITSVNDSVAEVEKKINVTFKNSNYEITPEQNQNELPLTILSRRKDNIKDVMGNKFEVRDIKFNLNDLRNIKFRLKPMSGLNIGESTEVEYSEDVVNSGSATDEARLLSATEDATSSRLALTGASSSSPPFVPCAQERSWVSKLYILFRRFFEGSIAHCADAAGDDKMASPTASSRSSSSSSNALERASSLKREPDGRYDELIEQANKNIVCEEFKLLRNLYADLDESENQPKLEPAKPLKDAVVQKLQEEIRKLKEEQSIRNLSMLGIAQELKEEEIRKDLELVSAQSADSTQSESERLLIKSKIATREAQANLEDVIEISAEVEESLHRLKRMEIFSNSILASRNIQIIQPQEEGNQIDNYLHVESNYRQTSRLYENQFSAKNFLLDPSLEICENARQKIRTNLEIKSDNIQKEPNDLTLSLALSDPRKQFFIEPNTQNPIVLVIPVEHAIQKNQNISVTEAESYKLVVETRLKYFEKGAILKQQEIEKLTERLKRGKFLAIDYEPTRETKANNVVSGGACSSSSRNEVGEYSLSKVGYGSLFESAKKKAKDLAIRSSSDVKSVFESSKDNVHEIKSKVKSKSAELYKWNFFTYSLRLLSDRIDLEKYQKPEEYEPFSKP